MINQLPPNEKIHIVRIQDKFEKFETRKVSTRLEVITKVRINPEFEILFIIFFDKYKDYDKVKSKIKASEFVKQKIDTNYNKQKKYVYNFFINLTNEQIYKLFKKYTEIVRTQGKDELTVLSLLKNLSN